MTSDNIMQIVVAVVATAYFIQSFLFGRMIRTFGQRADIKKNIDILDNAQMVSDLMQQMLKFQTMNLETQRDLVDAIKTLNDRVAAYNERLNELATLTHRNIGAFNRPDKPT